MSIKTFDPSQLSVVFGVTPINGFEENTAISIDMEEPEYNENKDIHGNVTRFKVNNSSATITVNLTQNSLSNDVLSSYAEADRTSNSGSFPIMIKDPNGTTLFSSAAAYIKQIPKVEFGNENKTREWVIRATNVSKFIGGIK